MKNIILSNEQKKLVDEAEDFYYNSSEQIFQYSGKAGTGKSVVMDAIIKRLGLSQFEVAPMAYVGAAAIVLRSKGLENAKTIHSWLFEPKIVIDKSRYNSYLNKYYTKLVFIDKPLPSDIKLICIDEAGSVPMSLKSKLLATGRKIIACGDLNQLPPVMDNPAFLYNGDVKILNHIMRQKENSGIIYIANRILEGEKINVGTYDNVDVITTDDLTDEMCLDSDIIICGFNRTKDSINKSIRKLHHIDPDKQLPVHGEQIICRKNNWQHEMDGISLANGLSGKVVSYPSMHALSKEGKLFNIDFKPLMFNCIFRRLKCSYEYFNASKERKDLIKQSTFSVGNLFELGYCITTHISQGSQYNKGIYISENLSHDIQKNLDYTGVTRFSNHCIFVVRNRKYY